jgi:hypothetical protein
MMAWYLRAVATILAVALALWALDRALYPPVPDRLVTKRRGKRPWYWTGGML